MSRRPLRRVAVVVALALGLATAATLASASSLTVVSQTLGATNAAVPGFYPTGVSTTAANRPGQPNRNDTITLTFSRPLQATSVCSGATAASELFKSVTIVISDGGLAPDTLAATAGPAACPLPRVGVIGLGSTGYAAGASITYTGSSLEIVQGPASASVILSLGTPSATAGTVAAATVVTYTPDAAITDSAGRSIGGSVARSLPAVQF